MAKKHAHGEGNAYRLADGRAAVAWHRRGGPDGADALGVVASIGWDPKTPRPAA